jgi:hypothetical protein
MQVRFGLSSSPVFSRTDTVTDSERFYNTVLDLFYDIEEQEEVNDLLTWWNRYVSTQPLFTYKLKHECTTVKYSLIIRQLDAPFAKILHWPG